MERDQRAGLLGHTRIVGADGWIGGEQLSRSSQKRAIVNAHNLLVSDWRVIITILGWLAIARGALSLLFPNKMYGIGEAILASRSGPMIGAVIILVLGGFLTWMGYRDLLKK